MNFLFVLVPLVFMVCPISAPRGKAAEETDEGVTEVKKTEDGGGPKPPEGISDHSLTGTLCAESPSSSSDMPMAMP